MSQQVTEQMNKRMNESLDDCMVWSWTVSGLYAPDPMGRQVIP